MRWEFIVVLKNTGEIAVNFERAEKATPAPWIGRQHLGGHVHGAL